MRKTTAGAIGGVVAGLIISGVMALGRDAGLLHETLADRASDWLDQRFGTRVWAGEDGTQALEHANHLAASAAFGAVYGATRPLTQMAPPVAAGALFGAGLYAVAIAGVAPTIDLTQDAHARRRRSSAFRPSRPLRRDHGLGRRRPGADRSPAQAQGGDGRRGGG